MQRLIARGTNVNVVEHGGNNCLHLALKRENNFHSEVEHMTMLDQFCVELKLGNEERCSGVVVASYLAHHGANFYCKNKSGRTPLDLIEKENLKKTLNMLFPPTQCVFCEDEVATETFFPCKHLSLCKKCCPPKIPKRCPMCRQNITSKNSLEGPKSSKPEVQMLAEPPVISDILTRSIFQRASISHRLSLPSGEDESEEDIISEHSTASIVPGASTDSGLQSSSGVDESEEGYYGRDFAKRTQLSSKQYEHSTGSMVSGASTDSGFKSYSGVDQSENDLFPKSQNKQ
ncbi:E3 ubiquitin-protein ligase MIB2-like, partial [Octopus sinensis]|uniref:E3 ubiquitin-protein ligase MIB2-like n=1 Tax=Octopus sinensis TaxID=2607531 RepID=A0A7E6EMC6_9MOLL